MTRCLLVFACISTLVTSQVYAAGDDLLGDIGDAPVRDRPKETKDTGENITLSGSKPKSESPGQEEAKPAVTVTQGADDKIKAVPRKRMLKRRRLELSPMASMSINDSFFTHFALGGSVAFYPHDAFGIGVSGEYFYARSRSSNIETVRRGATSVLASQEPPELFLHVDAHWVPVYGKVSLFDSMIVHFDLYATAGFGFAQSTGGNRVPASTVAIGQRFVLSDFLALRFELKDLFYIDTQDVNGIPRSDIQNFVMFMVGASFMVPPSFEYTR